MNRSQNANGVALWMLRSGNSALEHCCLRGTALRTGPGSALTRQLLDEQYLELNKLALARLVLDSFCQKQISFGVVRARRPEAWVDLVSNAKPHATMAYTCAHIASKLFIGMDLFIIYSIL